MRLPVFASVSGHINLATRSQKKKTLLARKARASTVDYIGCFDRHAHINALDQSDRRRTKQGVKKLEDKLNAVGIC